jgi:signal transduction histidine kinase
MAEIVTQQARAVLGDCLESVRTGTVVIDHETIVRIPLAASPSDCHDHLPTDVMRLADVLWRAASESIADVFNDMPDGARLVALWLRTLHESLSVRICAVMYGYDGGVYMRVEEMVAQDRRRLARDIHDWMGSGLSLASRNLDLYEVYDERNLPKAKDRIKHARRALDELMDGTRQLVSELAVHRIVGGLREELSLFVRSVASETDFEIVVAGDESLLTRNRTQELFLVIRECLRNIDRHSGAKRAVVLVDIRSDVVSVIVADDGVGFDLAAVDTRRSRSHGLQSMRDRMAMVGGELTIDTAPGDGTRVEILLPLVGREAATRLAG